MLLSLVGGQWSIERKARSLQTHLNTHQGQRQAYNLRLYFLFPRYILCSTVFVFNIKTCFFAKKTTLFVLFYILNC